MRNLRLDRFLSKEGGFSYDQVRRLILSRDVLINDLVAVDPTQRISRFDKVLCNGRVLQAGCEPLLLMLNKPKGVLSATKDPLHETVIDLINHPAKTSLHLVGRLDRSSTGLVLLTNNGHWSYQLMRPEAKMEKVYLVETASPIPPEAIEQFAEGFWFESEGIQTQPAKLELLGPTTARVTLTEGRWHQIKRMFFRLGEIRLLGLHRERIGPFCLPKELSEGSWQQVDPAVLSGPLPSALRPDWMNGQGAVCESQSKTS